VSSSISDRHHALCCICGQLRSVSSRNNGRNVQSRVSQALTPEQLAEVQARGHMLEVEPYWRAVNTFRCATCEDWTRHAYVHLDAAEAWRMGL
jgi:hypothetical protein